MFLRMLRAIGMLVGNLLTVMVGISAFVSELYGIFPAQTPGGGLRKETVLSAVVAFGLGYFVYYKWRSASAKWIFVAGLCWFGWGALEFWLGQRDLRVVSAGHTVYWEMSGIGCNSFDTQSCLDYIQYTLLLLRTIFYSAGAFCCSRIDPHSFAGIEDTLLRPMHPVDRTAENTEIEDTSGPRND
jgi:hypothetical protein